MNNNQRLIDRTPDAAASGALKSAALVAVFVALSAVGAMIKIPSPVGTVGLDSAPGFFIALGFSGWLGGAVAFIGHLITSGVAGFPFSLPIHIAIAVGMGLCAYVLGLCKKYGRYGWFVGCVVTTLLNSFGLGLIMLPIGGVALYLANIVPLLIGAIINIVIATLAWLSLRKTNLVS